MEYVFAIVNGHDWHHKLDPLYRFHYAEMQERLAAEGIPIGNYNPQLERYFAAMDGGEMISFVVLCEGEVAGYSNVWITTDMHNGEPIAMEDTIYMLPEHRRGVGRKLARHVLDHLQGMGIKRMHITATTDTRADVLFKRLGFRPAATSMIYVFEAQHVPAHRT